MTSARAGALLRWVVAAALVGLPAVAAALRMGPMGFLGIDDANIYFVYAKNLALGHGFVYHPGGERVEGFTSLLWTLLCAAAHRLAARPEPWLIVPPMIAIAVVVLAARSVAGSAEAR